jgi:gliding motility-associated-like protein
MTIRLVCANSACGDYRLIINIPLKVIDTAPLPDLHITEPYKKASPSSNSNFPYITNVCQGCGFPLPKAEDIKVDSGIIQSASISWFLPDTPAFSDTTRYGFATITLRSDSNICGYKSKTFTDQLVQIDIKTYSCKPIIYFGDPPSDTAICPCGTYNFGVKKPGGNAGAKCIYTEDSIIKRVIPEPVPQLNNPSLGSYNFQVLDSFKAYLSVTAQQQCPAGAPDSIISVTVKDSIEVTIDDRKCPFIVDYYYCPNDTGYISFTRTFKEGKWEKEVLYVDFFPPHGDTSIKRDAKRDTFVIDSLRTDYHTVYYKTRDIIKESLKLSYSNTHFYDTVRYRVTYRRNICGDTAFYDTFAIFRIDDYCEPKISVQASACAGDKIYINVREVSRAVIIDSFIIKDSAEFYVLKPEKDTVITSYSLFDSTWDYDISQHIQHTIRAYTKNKQNRAILNIPITVYWRDTLDPYWHDSIRITKTPNPLINYNIYDCMDLQRYTPICIGQNINSTQLGRRRNFLIIEKNNSNTHIDSVKISFDSTTPHLKHIKTNNSKLIFETTQFAKSVNYKIDVNYNINDSSRYKQFTFTCTIDDCAPSIIASKDTICAGDTMSIKVINHNIGRNVRIHRVIWGSSKKMHIDSIKSIPAKWGVDRYTNIELKEENDYTLYHANIYSEDSIIPYEIQLAVNTILGYDTIIKYYDTLRVFINPKPNIFPEDSTFYYCQNSIIDLRQYEDMSILIQDPIYSIGIGQNPNAYTPSNVGTNAIIAEGLCKYHCDIMVDPKSNIFEDTIFIFVEQFIQNDRPKSDTFACINSSVPLSVNSSGRLITWIIDGVDTIAKNIPIEQVIYHNVANVSQQLVAVVSNSCGSLTEKFYIHPNPLPEFKMPPAMEKCAGTVANIKPVYYTDCSTYSWSGFGQSGTSQDIDIPLDENSITGYVTLTVFSDANCSKKDSVLLTPLPYAPAVIAGGDSINVCLHGNTSFSASFTGGSDEVVSSWEYPASSSISDNGSEVAIDSADNLAQGLYIYTTDLNGCFSSDSIFVSVLPLPQISISGLSFVCIGDTAFLTGISPDADYMQWQGSDNFNVAFPITEAGRYYVDAYKQGCVSTASFDVTQRPKPKFSVGQDTIICHKEIVILAAPYRTYPNFWWQDGSKENTCTVTNTGKYSVTAEKDSCYKTESVVVEVVYCGALRFPSAFTPNDDNLNDCFMPVNSVRENNLVYELIIYNRLGQRIFSTTNPNDCWDGTFRGKPCEGGVYTFRCIANIIFPDRNVSASGTVTLIR